MSGKVAQQMEGSDWQGGRKDGRLYRRVRAEMQRVIREKYKRLKGCLDERARRLWAGSEAITFGRGGIRPGRVPPAAGRQRRPGGGRKAKAEQEPGLVKAVAEIVDRATRGDPMRSLKWTSKSLDKICGGLKQQD
ncbi:MAG: hypothetical protein EXQ58_08995 [Acidobacteria bacterium]|nr:hypothetical protein [Acidobacteriota bacterium]